ncbi:hypothetical protein [Streptomyces sp. SID13031]|uniref:hypothetical protein n=1 Tax=Streptomyces sp. SID13031 TaxID=2706046 RepID=UPI0013CC42F0|nr:hypothetical protein [Streptomyces sp. SID13031]NEA32834.1 hypothetical protein [Streptomyces sp. SID13031]
MPLVDLDDPEELRARWSALAAVAHATGYDRRWYADENGWYHQDETGSDLRMQRLEGGRAVLFGFHTQHTQTAEAELLAGAPEWIGQPEVKRRIAAGELGFVYGSFNGTWARASYPGDPWQPLDDGFLPIGEWITSDEEAAREMIEWAAEWADYLGGLDELLPVGVRLIRTAASTGLTQESLLELFDRLGIGPQSPQQPDLRAALSAASQFNGTAPSQSTPTTRASAPTRTPAPAAAPVPSARPAPPAPAPAAPAGPALVVPVAPAAAAELPVDEADDEESFIVPPGISPFTGQPIGDDANLIIGGSEPYTSEPPFTPEPPPAPERPFTPEPPLTPEPPFRPDSPFAPEPRPYAPEPPYRPEPDADPPYQPEDAGDQHDAYGVVAKKPRLFRRRKHDDPTPPSPVGSAPAEAPQPTTNWSKAAPYTPSSTPDRRPPYADYPTDGRAIAPPYADYSTVGRATTPPYTDQPGADRPAGASYGQQPTDGRSAPVPYTEPATVAPYVSRDQADASAPSVERPMPSSEPPRVGGPVDDGEDFYASLFADAPAAATYVPDVIRDTPAAPDSWSADDATSEFIAVTDTPAAADPAPAVSASDDTGVIPPIPSDEIAPQNHFYTSTTDTDARQPTSSGPDQDAEARREAFDAPEQDAQARPDSLAGTGQGAEVHRETLGGPGDAAETRRDNFSAPAGGADFLRDTFGSPADDVDVHRNVGGTSVEPLGTRPEPSTATERIAEAEARRQPFAPTTENAEVRQDALGQPPEGIQGQPHASDTTAENAELNRNALGTPADPFEARQEPSGSAAGNFETGSRQDALGTPMDALGARQQPLAPTAENAAADQDTFDGTAAGFEPDRESAESTPESFEAGRESAESTPGSFEAGRGSVEAGAWSIESDRRSEAIAEYEAVVEAEPEAAPEPPAAPAQREWIGGAWINGVWIEDVAAYLAAQNAAGPAKSVPAQSQPAEDLTAAQPEEPPTEERILDVSELPTEEPPTEEHVLGLNRLGQPAEEPPTEERVLGGNQYGQPAGEPPIEERVLGVDEYALSAGESPAVGGVRGGGGPGQSVEEPPTEEHVLDLAEFEEREEPLTDARVLGHAAERIGGSQAGEQLGGLPVEDQLVGVPAEDQVLGLPGGDVLGEQAAAEASPDAGGEPVVVGHQAQVEDEAPTAEIAAITEQDLEDEYYASGSTPFAPPARDIPPNGFSSLEPLGDLDYRMADEEFHDEILGGADWTADQLGEPREPAAVDVTAQFAPVQDTEQADAQSQDGESKEGDQAPGASAEVAGEAPAGAEHQLPADAQHQEPAEAQHQEPADAQHQEPADAQPEELPDARSQQLAGAVGGVQAEALREAEAQREVRAGVSAEEPPAEARPVEAEGQVEASVAERPEKLVVPDEGGGSVAIPGLGVVDSPRVETPPGSIEEAMRAEVERPRPRPKESDAFKAVRDWCRARTKVVPSGFTIQVQVLDPAAPSYRFDLEPPEVDDPQYGSERLSELLGDLWIAESQGEQGGWLFARLDAAGRTLRIDRWYDSVPDWWDNPIESRLDVNGLVRRLNGRGPDWQPSYLEKLYISAR